MKTLAKTAYYVVAAPAMLVGLLSVVCRKGYQSGEAACYRLWSWVNS